MFEIVLFLLGVTVLPIVINKTTEQGRFDFIHPHLRWLWTLLLVVFTWYLLAKPSMEQFIMELRDRSSSHVAASYVIAAILGAVALCFYWWFTGWALARPAITGTERISVLIPLLVTSPNSPFAIDENEQDPHAEFYARLMSLAGKPDNPPADWPPFRVRKFTDQEECFRFVTRLVQSYILDAVYTIQRGRQGTKWLAGVGITTINKSPVSVPQSQPYPLTALQDVVPSNEFLARNSFLWRTNPFVFPKGSTVSFSERDEVGKLFGCFVTIERPHYFTVEFTVEPSVGAIMVNSGPALPAGFVSQAQQYIRTYTVDIKMKYTIEQRFDGGFQPQEYVAWATSIFSGLKDATGYN